MADREPASAGTEGDERRDDTRCGTELEGIRCGINRAHHHFASERGERPAFPRQVSGGEGPVVRDDPFAEQRLGARGRQRQRRQGEVADLGTKIIRRILLQQFAQDRLRMGTAVRLTQSDDGVRFAKLAAHHDLASGGLFLQQRDTVELLGANLPGEADSSAGQEGRREHDSDGTPWSPPGHAEDGARRPDGACAYRLTTQEAREVIGQFPCGGIAAARLLLQTLQAKGLQVCGNAGLESADGNGIEGFHLLDDRMRRLAEKRRAAGEQFVKNRADGIHVRGRSKCRAPPRRLLRRHVGRRAENLAGESELGVGS